MPQPTDLPRKRVATLLSAASFVVGAVVVPLLLLTGQTEVTDTTLKVLTVAITVYAAAHLSVLIAQGQPRLSSGVFWVFVYVSFGVAPLCQIDTGLYPNLADPNYLDSAAALVLVGLFAYDIGHASTRGRTASRKLIDISHARPIHVGRVKLLGVIGVLLTLYTIATTGLASLFAGRGYVAGATQSGVYDTSQAGSAILASVERVPILVAWIAWTVYQRRQPSGKTTVAANIWWLVLFAANIAINNPISNSRYFSLTVLCGIFFAFPIKRPGRYRAALILGVLAAVIIFPYADYTRTAAANRGPLQTNSVPVELSIKDYDQMTMTANTLWYVEHNGHTFGKQLTSSALFFVPHSLWPGRARDTGVVVGSQLPDAASNVNVSSPLWDEFWIDFGWLGLVLGFLLVGRVSRRFDDLFVRLHNMAGRPGYVLDVAVPLIIGYQFILLRGPLLQAMGRLVVIILACWFIRGRRTSSSVPKAQHEDAEAAALPS